MPLPGDAEDVIRAVRLGWAVAEVRGRNRPDAPTGSTEPVPKNLSNALPLHFERGRTELRIEAQAVLTALALALKVDSPAPTGLAGKIDDAAKLLWGARKTPPDPPGCNPEEQWAQLSDLIWKFDARCQDQLSASSVTLASGYQLGRGLAETYWALEPGAAGGWSGWTFLLGKDRCEELERLIGLLSAYMPEYTAPAIAGSIAVWEKVASDPLWRRDGSDTSTYLNEQVQRWYDLIILAQDPTTLVKPGQVMRNFRTMGRAIKFFWPQALAVIGSAAALAWLGHLLTASGSSAWGKIAAAILGVLGLSIASVTAYLKNVAQAMMKRLRQDAYTDLIAAAVQTAPPRRTTGNPSLQSWKVYEAIGARGLTTSVPN